MVGLSFIDYGRTGVNLGFVEVSRDRLQLFARHARKDRQLAEGLDLVWKTPTSRDPVARRGIADQPIGGIQLEHRRSESAQEALITVSPRQELTGSGPGQNRLRVRAARPMSRCP